MKSRKLNYLFILIVIFIGCENNEEVNLQLFIPTFSVTYKQLLKNNFTKVLGADIPMYSKINRDTTVVFTFNFDNNKPLTKTWYIQLKDTEEKTILKFLKEHNLSTKILSRLKNEEVDTNEKYYIYNFDFNQIYSVFLNSDNNEIMFTYYYYYKLDNSIPELPTFPRE